MDNIRSKIIHLLRQHEIMSGEDIAKLIGVSRTAVWKHVKVLQTKGYSISAIRQQGYQLNSVPEIPVEEIQAQLHTSHIGTKLLYFSSLSSTNDYASKLAKHNHPNGTVVIAGTQTLGRGRKQRVWLSPEGGLWFSFFIQPPLPPQKAMLVTMAASIALTQAISSITGVIVRIKWPNDLLINGKKVCGILTELSAEMDQINYMVIGIGLNVNNELPDTIQSTATSLKDVTRHDVSLKQLLLAMLASLDEWYTHVIQKHDSLILETWCALSDTIGKEIEVHEAGFVIKGVAKGISENYALLVETGHGTKTIVTGDICYL